MKRGLSILSAMLLCAGTLLASDVQSEFSAANRFYSEGKFTEAARTYQGILNSGVLSVNLLFNEGNAEFKAGNLGRAIADYHRAALLAPRDTDIRANLGFARNQVQGPTLGDHGWVRVAGWLGALTLNEWTVAAAIAFWLVLALFAAMQIQPAWKKYLRGVTRLMLVAACCAGAALAVAATIHFTQYVAVVVSSDSTARSGPFDDAQTDFTVHDGAELSVLDQRNGWIQVTDGNGRIGWLPQEQVEVLPEI